MRFLLLVHGDEGVFARQTAARTEQMLAAVGAGNAALAAGLGFVPA